MAFHGDVTDNQVIFLRFHGPKWDEPDPRAGSRVATFVRHEAFHLWNRVQEPDAPPWLHEGGAEYAAIVAAVDGGRLTQDQGMEQVAYYVGRCRAALGAEPIAELPAKGSAVYACGVTAQWLADLEARSVTDGDRNTFTLWQDLLTIADTRKAETAAPSGYGVLDFPNADR